MVTIGIAPRLIAEAAPPSNDDFNNATLIAGLPFTDSTDISEATTDGADPSPCGNYPNNSVWYRYTPATSGVIQINTAGSSYTTAVGVFTGDSGMLYQVNCSVYNFSFNTYVDAGTTYSIMVVALSGGYPYP